MENRNSVWPWQALWMVSLDETMVQLKVCCGSLWPALPCMASC